MSEKIDWSNVENLEFTPDSGLEDHTIVAVYKSDSASYPRLVVIKDKQGRCRGRTFTEDGSMYWGCDPLIRNKPKRVKLEEFWVIYTPEGVRLTFTRRSDAAADCAKRGYIVRHIPAEEREV